MASQDNSIKPHWGYSSLLIPVVALLAVLGIAVVWILGNVRSMVDDRLRSSLQTVLDTSDKALRIWVGQTEADVSVLADSGPLVSNVEMLLSIGRNSRVLRASPALGQIRQLLSSPMKSYQLKGFAIIANDGIQIAGDADRAIGTTEIANKNRDLLTKTSTGNVGLGLPYKSKLFVDAVGREYSVMTFAAPIRDHTGKVIATLALSYDPRQDFTETLRLARLENTGETYAFDHQGRLLSESRFDSLLHTAGLLPGDEDSVLNIELRDPGGNTVERYHSRLPRQEQPLTKMAESAVRGNSGMDLAGYRDYRGVPVIGAWLWDNQLGMGLATEINRAEALAAYRRVQILTLSMLILMVGVSIILLLILRHRDRVLAANRDFHLAMNARDDMMAIVAHDLKNPLNTMLLRSHIMLQMTEECGGLKSTDIRRNLELLRQTAYHMNRLIGDLTDAAKIHAGKLYLELKHCTLQEILEPVIEKARLLATEKRVEFVANACSESLPLSADKSRITQALDNLLGNALKFTPPGGRITISASPFENAVKISVADTGPGIPNEVLPRVFEPYWQVQKTRSGMGLGLFIAKTIIHGHGGRIWVESCVGKGTTFHFTLPLISNISGHLTEAA